MELKDKIAEIRNTKKVTAIMEISALSICVLPMLLCILLTFLFSGMLGQITQSMQVSDYAEAFSGYSVLASLLTYGGSMTDVIVIILMLFILILLSVMLLLPSIHGVAVIKKITSCLPDRPEISIEFIRRDCIIKLICNIVPFLLLLNALISTRSPIIAIILIFFIVIIVLESMVLYQISSKHI